MMTARPRAARPLIALFGLALLAAACGGGNGSDDSAGDGAAAKCGTASTSPDADGTIALAATDNNGADNCFDFTVLELTAGEEVMVELENTGTVAHTFTIQDWDVDTDLVDPGDTKMVTFTVPDDASGDVTFVCTVHKSMGQTGTIKVS